MDTLLGAAKKNWKRYLMSSLITFLTGFCLVLVGEIDHMTLDGLKTGAYLGVLFAAARAGIKAVIEAFLDYQSKT